MRADDPNLPLLRAVALPLGELCERLVFVGGAVAGLLVTDPLAEGIRATRDVDAVIDAGYAAFQQVEAALMDKGFTREMDSGVICRWVHRDSGSLFDLMPVRPEVLGFSNRWYPFAVESAEPFPLGDGLVIRVASALAFVATKLEAFSSRGGGDILGSHDLEDILAVVDGRDTLPREWAGGPPAVRDAVAQAFRALIAHPDFLNALPGLIAESDRAAIVLSRLRDMSR